jgi:hypothetical protein
MMGKALFTLSHCVVLSALAVVGETLIKSRKPGDVREQNTSDNEFGDHGREQGKELGKEQNRDQRTPLTVQMQKAIIEDQEKNNGINQ